MFFNLYKRLNGYEGETSVSMQNVCSELQLAHGGLALFE